MSSYAFGRNGGHAKSDARDAFCAALEVVYRCRGQAPFPQVALDGRMISVEDACGLVWNCSDTLPSSDCGIVEGLTGVKVGSYASAARRIKSLVA